MLKKLKSLVIGHRSLVIILIIASFLRLNNLTELPPGLYPDEAINGNNAVEAMDIKDWKIFYPENFGREGLFINIQSFFIAVFGNKPWALRLPSAIFGILTVLGLYFFTKELFSNYRLPFTNYQVALLSSFLLATSFWHINFSRIGFRAIIAPFFLTWGLYFFLKSLNANRYALYAILAGLTYSLGFHSYIAYRATPLLMLFIGYYLYKNYSFIRTNKRMVFLLFSIAALIAVLPLGIYFIKNPADFLGRTAGISIFTSETLTRDLGVNILKTSGMFNVAGDFNWRHNVAGRPLLFWPVGIFFLIGIYSSLKRIFKEKKWLLPEAVIWGWLLVALLPVIISNEGLPHALRSLLMAPPVFILTAIGGLNVYELLKSKLSGRISLVTCYLFLSLLLFESYVTYFVTWGQNPNVKNAFAHNDSVISEYLNSLPRELPKYVILREKVSGSIRRDNPISLQTILFLTDTFTQNKKEEKNIFYVTQEENNLIPADSIVINL